MCGASDKADDPGNDDQNTYRIAAPKRDRRARRRRRPAPPAFPDSGLSGEPPDRTERSEAPTEPVPAAELDRFGDRRREQLVVDVDPPPARPFLSNVFGFPWQSSVIGRWMFLSLGMTIVVTLAMIMVALYRAVSSVVSAVLAFIGLPAFWIGTWTFSYAAACLLVIVQETAAGNNEIRDWMEPNWREWLGQLGYVLYLAALPLAVAWPIVGISGYSYSEAAIVLVVLEFVVFPVVLLSALEVDSLLIPYSSHVLRSFGHSFFPWVVFYILTSLLAATCGGALYFGATRIPLFSGLFVGPLLAAAALIYARLLGRLGWVIVERGGEDKPDRTIPDRSLTLPAPAVEPDEELPPPDHGSASGT